MVSAWSTAYVATAKSIPVCQTVVMRRKIAYRAAAEPVVRRTDLWYRQTLQLQSTTFDSLTFYCAEHGLTGRRNFVLMIGHSNLSRMVSLVKSVGKTQAVLENDAYS